jgi:bacterioferritin-associated ferredoxin
VWGIRVDVADVGPRWRGVGRERRDAIVIVCHCKGLSDRDIRAAVRDGARSCRQVGRACEAGRTCGGCRPVIRELIRDEAGGEAGPGLLSVASVVAPG